MDERFKQPLAYALFCGERTKRFPPDVAQRAQNKLKFLYATASLEDLRFPPGNRLEALGGDRQDIFSIRVNDQWRICFSWFDGRAQDIEIIDYH